MDLHQRIARLEAHLKRPGRRRDYQALAMLAALRQAADRRRRWMIEPLESFDSMLKELYKS